MRKLLPALALLLCGSAFASAPPSEITRHSVLAEMNVYRAAEGLPPLAADDRLDKAAADRMRDMEDTGYWGHVSPEGVSPFVWVLAREYPYAAAAENLAAGFETVRLLVQSWMESPGHRANIVDGKFEDCGIAIIDGSTKGPATGKSIVVLFGGKLRQFAATTRP